MLNYILFFSGTLFSVLPGILDLFLWWRETGFVFLSKICNLVETFDIGSSRGMFKWCFLFCFVISTRI